jgi:DNA-binding CsgD family transcriptional regulator
MQNSGRGDWDECVDRLYDAAGNEQDLAGALGRFRPLLGAERSTFFTVPQDHTQQSAFIATHNVPLDSLVEYQAHFFKYDEWVAAGLRKGLMVPGPVWRGSDLVPRTTLKRSYFWNNFLRRHQINDILTTVVEPPSRGAPAALCTYQRVEGQPPYEPWAYTRMVQLAPHLRRVWRLHFRIAPQMALGTTLQEIYRTLDVPMLFLARDGSIVENNAAGQALLERMTRTLQRRADGSLHYRDAASWRPAAQALATFENGVSTTVDLQARDTASGESVVISLRRVHGAFTDRLAQHPLAAICTFTSSKPDDLAGLRARFKLTRMETELAQLLAQGASLQSSADKLGVAISTARTHLSELFSKTRTRRQGELVALLLRAR